MSRKYQVKAVPVSWILHEGRRLDCGPYMSGAVEARELLQSLPMRKDPLQSLTKDGISGIINPGRITRNWVDDPEHGYRFLSSTEILQSDLSNISLIAKSAARQNANLLIDKDWILITRSGTVGRMAYSRSDMSGLACTEDVLRVIPNPEVVKPGYIYAYLTTRFGVPLVVSGTYGSIITHLEPHHIADLPVPRLGEIEDKAHDLVQRAADLRVVAAAQINESTSRYLAAAGLDNISPYEWIKNSGRTGFTAKISRSILRAVNYIPLNQQLVEHVKIKSPKWMPLGKVTEQGTLKRGLRFKRVDADQEFGLRLVGQREGFHFSPEGRWIAKSYLRNDPLINLSEGAIVVASQGGINESDSFARAQFVYGKKLEYVYSEHFLRIISNEHIIPRGALFAYIRSNLAFRLLRSCAVGSMQQDFHPDLLAELPVPLIAEDEAKAIDILIRDSFQKYDEAIDCEDQARAIVEEAIEKGGH